MISPSEATPADPGDYPDLATITAAPDDGDDALVEVEDLLESAPFNRDGLAVNILELRDDTYAIDVETNGIHVVETWAWFRKRIAVTGLFPVMLSGDTLDQIEDVADREVVATDPRSVEDALSYRRNWLLSSEGRHRWAPKAVDGPRFEPDDERFWVPTTPSTSLPSTAAGDVGLFPVSAPWQVIDLLAWEDGNTLRTNIHSAVQRQWYEQYGAGLVAIDGAIVQLIVPAGAVGRATALDLALEVASYGDTFGNPELGTINEIATFLTDSTVWEFWWD